MLKFNEKSIIIQDALLNWPIGPEDVAAVMGKWSRISTNQRGYKCYTWDDHGITILQGEPTFYLYQVTRALRFPLRAPEKPFRWPVFIDDIEIRNANDLRDRTDLLDCIGSEPADWDVLGEEDEVIVPLGHTMITIKADFDTGAIISISAYFDEEI